MVANCHLSVSGLYVPNVYYLLVLVRRLLVRDFTCVDVSAKSFNIVCAHLPCLAPFVLYSKYDQECRLGLAGFGTIFATIFYFICQMLICCTPRPQPLFNLMKPKPKRVKKRKDGQVYDDGEYYDDDQYLDEYEDESGYYDDEGCKWKMSC